mmetsp:Transcript_4396/g.6962  ORF Transcript_4396/g.6962 Transcript_4396/m.6962 type:complete len:334 (+) Transcript_4396:118-1119(+)
MSVMEAIGMESPGAPEPQPETVDPETSRSQNQTGYHEKSALSISPAVSHQIPHQSNRTKKTSNTKKTNIIKTPAIRRRKTTLWDRKLLPAVPGAVFGLRSQKSLLSAHTSSLVAVPVPILVLRCLQTPSQCVTPVQTGRRGSETQTFQMLARKTAFLRIHDLILVAQKCWMSCPELFVFFAEALTKKLHRCHDLRSRQELLPSLTSLWSTLSVKPHCTTECNGLRNSMCSALTKLVPVMDVGTSVLVLKGLQETVHHFSTADSANQTLETSIALGLIGAVKERTRDSSKRPFFPKHQRSSVLSVRDRRWGKWRIWRMCRRIVHLLQTTSNQTS